MTRRMNDTQPAQDVDGLPVLKLLHPQGTPTHSEVKWIEKGCPAPSLYWIWIGDAPTCVWRLGGMNQDAGTGHGLQLGRGPAVVDVVVRQDDTLDLVGPPPQGPKLPQDRPPASRATGIDQRDPLAEQCEYLGPKRAELMNVWNDLHMAPSASRHVHSKSTWHRVRAGRAWHGQLMPF
jgi:hypothetical protein